MLLALVGAAVALFQALFSRPPWNSEMEARLLRVASGALGNHLEVMHVIWTRTTPGRVMFVVLVLLVVVVGAWRISLRISRYLSQS